MDGGVMTALFTELPAEVQAEALLSDITALKDHVGLFDREYPPGRELSARDEWHVARGYAELYAQLAEAIGDLVDLYFDQHQYDLGDAANREYDAYIALWRSWQQRADQARAQLTPCCQARVIATIASVRCSRCERPVTPLRPCGAIA
jgi:hypothetical protein